MWVGDVFVFIDDTTFTSILFCKARRTQVCIATWGDRFGVDLWFLQLRFSFRSLVSSSNDVWSYMENGTNTTKFVEETCFFLIVKQEKWEWRHSILSCFWATFCSHNYILQKDRVSNLYFSLLFVLFFNNSIMLPRLLQTNQLNVFFRGLLGKRLQNTADSREHCLPAIHGTLQASTRILPQQSDLQITGRT